MPALVADRLTKSRSGDQRELPAKAGAKFHAGAMAAVDANGFAVPMSTAATLRGLGRVERAVDNSGGTDGAVRVRIGAGTYHYANSAGADEITAADIGADCYGVDDQTVAKTNGTDTRSVAGKVFDVDAQGVWVKFS